MSLRRRSYLAEGKRWDDFVYDFLGGGVYPGMSVEKFKKAQAIGRRRALEKAKKSISSQSEDPVKKDVYWIAQLAKDAAAQSDKIGHKVKGVPGRLKKNWKRMKPNQLSSMRAKLRDLVDNLESINRGLQRGI